MATTETSYVSDSELVKEKSDELMVTVLPVTIIFGIEIVFGIIGNLLTMYVFFFRYRPCNFRYFVLGLAATDFISCLTTLPGEMVSYTHWYNYKFTAICKVKDLFNQATVLSEASFLTFIAVDRYRKVCRPFGWQFTKKVSICLCFVIFVASTVLAIPTPIFWGVRHVNTTYHNRNITVTLCEKDNSYWDTPYPLANVITNGSLVCIADLSVVVLYVLVVRRLHVVQRRQIQLGIRPTDVVIELRASETSRQPSVSDTPNGTDRHEQFLREDESDHVIAKTTTSNDSSEHPGTALTRIARIRRRTLLGFYLTAIFIFTTVLYWSLLTLVSKSNGILDELSDPQKGAYFFFLRLYFINHCVNPILYGMMDPQFKAEMRRLKAMAPSIRCGFTSKCGFTCQDKYEPE